MSGSVVSFASSNNSKVLSEEAVRIPRLKNDASPVKNGFRSISDTSYMTEDLLDSEATVEIPEYLESAEPFEFLEFTKPKARSLWTHYSQMVIDYPDMFDIMQIAKYHVENSAGDAIDKGDK
ncbi:hypothetical protein MMC29_000450 [Sticta canariensis]|nr:hypothetical protein [Sticta canariensis]